MLRIINYNSGELEILDGEDGDSHSIRLSREQANRLVLLARMHHAEHFLEKLPKMIPEEHLVATISQIIQSAEKTKQWMLKEKFARLHTVAPDIEPENPDGVKETVEL